MSDARMLHGIGESPAPADAHIHRARYRGGKSRSEHKLVKAFSASSTKHDETEVRSADQKHLKRWTSKGVFHHVSTLERVSTLK